MFWYALFFSMIVAALLAAVLGYGFKRQGPWGGLFWFFLLVFFGAWAIGVWATPVGPITLGVSWVPILLGGLALALILAAIPEPPRGTRGSLVEPVGAPVEAAPSGALGVLFWIALMGLIVLVGAAYWR